MAPPARTPEPEFDLFVSYAHSDDRGENSGKVSALVDAIKAEYARTIGAPLAVFFDTEAILAMDDWEARILTGLRQSKMMVAVLSPAYFASDYCRKEWEIYVETELAHALPGEGIKPIYAIKHPAFEADPVEERIRNWIKDLRRRQYIEWLPFWPEGARALEREDVRRKLAGLPGQIAERLKRKAIRDGSPNTVPLPSVHFAGRRDEMHDLLTGLIQDHVGAVTAVHGIPGIGKSMLAFAYAWGYGFKYPGGRFLIQAGGQSDLAGGVIALAEPKGVVLSDHERQSPEVALAKVKAAFEAGPPALIVVDNLDDPSLLAEPARDRVLPRGDHIHVLVTTRIAPEHLPRIRCLPLDALQPDDALALLQSFRPTADSPQDDEWKAALEIVSRRLGGHALAVEVVGVFMAEHRFVSYRALLEHLEREGIMVLEEEVGPEAAGGKIRHAETCIARLLEPTLASLKPEERRAVEFAAFLALDNVPIPWLRELLLADFPALARTGLIDPIATNLERLARLRLIVPLEHERDRTRGLPAAPGSDHLARMHRLVQDVVRARLDADERIAREQAVHQHADDRGAWLESHWGQPGLAWELPPLRDLALRRIDQGERGGCLLANAIATPLLHTGRMLDARDLWRRSASMFERLCAAAPENADCARDLAISFERLGDLARSSGDPAAARRFYEDGLKIRQRLADAAPENADYARDLSVSFERLGDLARSSGDRAAARRFYEDGLKIRQRLADAAPDNADYARGLWVSYWRMARIAEGSDRPDAALEWWRRAYEVLNGLKQAGRFVSPEDEGFLKQLEKKMGLS